MTLKASIRRSLRWMPAPWKAKLEYHFDPAVGTEFGGPFNGQAGRQQIFRDLVDAFQFQAVVETGTFRGTTTAFIAQNTDAPIYTVELDLRMYHFAKLRLRDLGNVTVKCGDSRSFLKELIADPTVARSNVFFYLDAHWNDDLPLYEEFAIIAENWTDSVVMVDDFEVPGDDGYEFDDYGDGKKLCLDYLGASAVNDWSTFFPSLESSGETGFRRGCVVLGSKSLENELNKIPSLTAYSG
jgi:hypothetical protein